MSYTPNREELAWSAGLFDGEGWVGYTGVSRRGGHQFSLVVNQVDRRVLDRFAAAVGVGHVSGPRLSARHDGYHRQPQYRYAVGSHPQVQAVCALLWTWLSPVKRAQFREALTTALPVSHRRHRPPVLCEHGLRRWKSGGCRPCWSAYMRRYYGEHQREYAGYRRRARHERAVRR